MASVGSIGNAISDGTFLRKLRWKAWRPFLARLSPRDYDAMHMQAHAARKLGRWPNIRTPETFNDHTLANMLAHERQVLKNFVTDKEFAKTYVRGRCPEMAIPRTFAVLRSEAEIMDYPFEPPCVVKPTHTMGGGVIHRSGAIDREKVLRGFRRSYYQSTREPQYKCLDHKIIVEELLTDPEGGTPPDWKIHCFFGTPRLVQVIKDRGQRVRARFYTTDWTALPISLLYPIDEDFVPKPPCLAELLRYATVFAEDFQFCRMDVYVIGETIYFGEITPYHGGASQPWLCQGASSLQVDRALAPLFETPDADPRRLLSKAGLVS